MPSHAPGCIAATAATAFAGVSISISAVQHPAALEAGLKTYVKFFKPMFKRGAPFQASLAGLSAIGAAAQASQTGLASNLKALWAASAAVFAGIIPYTIIAMVPTNDKLVAAADEAEPKVSEADFVKWGKLHAGRTVASVVGLSLMIYALSKQK